MDIKEIIVSALIGTVAVVEKAYADKLIQTLKEHSTAEGEWEQNLKLGYQFLKKMSDIVSKTPTPIDDVLVAPLLTAIITAASNDGIVLE